MLEPATASWGLSISDADFKKLTAGLQPQDQDDKWRITVSDENQNGNISVTMARTLGNKAIYILFINPNNGGSGATIEAITWEQNKGGIHLIEEQAKKEVVMITRGILECDYEALPEYDFERDMLDYYRIE